MVPQRTASGSFSFSLSDSNRSCAGMQTL
ncbi:rCG61411 [Rattus norvegicus]|uniref:RCG61411 n=1 Tax=Rattus norvegicus TaxID=10116 RepID=A6HB02_RAT|nr:rCG61411 [Rattus norvegicus]